MKKLPLNNLNDMSFSSINERIGTGLLEVVAAAVKQFNEVMAAGRKAIS